MSGCYRGSPSPGVWCHIATRSGKALSGIDRDPSPFAREAGVRKKALFLGGGKKAYERRLLTLPVRKELGEKAHESKVTSACNAYPMEGSRVPSRERAWRTRGGNPL
jgi:hypothetical protein